MTTPSMVDEHFAVFIPVAAVAGPFGVFQLRTTILLASPHTFQGPNQASLGTDNSTIPKETCRPQALKSFCRIFHGSVALC